MPNPSICNNGRTSAYVDGSVVVLCASFWGPGYTSKSSRPITTQTLSAVESGGLLIMGDSISRIGDIRGFAILHELMHWATWDGVSSGGSSFGVGDGNGYSWSDIVAGSANSPTNTAQLYSFLCYGRS